MDPNRNDNKPPKKDGGKEPKNGLWVKLMIAVAAVFVISSIYNMINDSQYNQTTWSHFRDAMANNQIVEVELQYDRIIYLTAEEAAKPAAKPYDFDAVEGSDSADAVADAISQSLEALVGSTQDTLPKAEPRHPVNDTTTGKFANLQFGRNYDVAHK